MTKHGKLSKQDMDALNKARQILSKWTEWAEDEGLDDYEISGWQYDTAMNVVWRLGEFVDSYEMA